MVSRGLKNQPSRWLSIEEILLLCLERGEFLKKCGNFAGKFGKGKVLSIDAATRDYMVTVEFQEYGIKKMLAGFARLKKQ